MCVNRHVTIIYFGVLREHQHCTAPPPHCCVNLKPPSEREEETRLSEDFFLKRRNGDNKKHTHIFGEGHENICYLVITQLLVWPLSHSNSFLKRERRGDSHLPVGIFSHLFFFSCCFIFWPRRRKATLIDDKKVLFFLFFFF